MALAKSITLPSGVVTTYHRIMGASVNYGVRTVDVRTASYLSRDERAGGCSPVVDGPAATFSFDQLGDAATEPARPILYAALKKLPAFSGAEDA